MNIIFYHKGTIPLAYIIPKNKDLKKYRPIISYANHSLKKLLKLASRGFSHILKNIKSVNHFNSTKTTDIMDFIKNINMKKNIQSILIKGDIKEIYHMKNLKKLLFGL